MKNTLKIIASMFFAWLLVCQPAFAADMPDSSILDYYNRNGIYYYNPSGKCDSDEKVCSSNDGSDLTVIGDSILADESTKEKMKAKFDHLPENSYDAVVSRNWSQGLEIARQTTLKSTVLFELGSNNVDGLSQKDIDDLIKIVGNNRKIVLVTNYGTAAQYQKDYNQNNELFKKNAETNENIIIADWAAKAAAEHANMDSMTVHPADNAARDLYVEVIYDALNTSCVSGRAVIKGTTAAEKVWSGLTSLGFTDEQTAGIMGNMQHESNSFNPVQHEGSQYRKYWPMDLGGNSEKAYGLGLIQWSFGRRINMYNYIKEQAPDLLKFFNSPEQYSMKNGSIYGCNGDCFIEAVGDQIADQIYSLELTFLYDELNSHKSYSGIFNQQSVYDSAKFFLEHVEIPQNPQIEHHMNRATDAQKWYDQFHGTTISGTGSRRGSGSGSSSGQQYLSGSNKDYEGNQILSDDQMSKINQYKPLYEKIVEGTQIPWQIMATIHYLENGLSRTTSHDPLCNNGQCSNGIFQVITKQYEAGIEVTDEQFVQMGKDAIAAELKIYSSGINFKNSDDVKRFFFTYNGKAQKYIQQARDLGFSEKEANNGEGSPYVMNRADQQRDPNHNKTTWGQIKQDHGPLEYPANQHYGAFIIYQVLGGTASVNGCSTGISGAGNMDLNQTALDLAWPVGDPHVGTMTPTDNYRRAYTQVGLDGIMPGGSSCDVFVSTVARYSGVDPDFACCGVQGTNIPYLEKSPKWEEIKYTNPNDTSFLRPGDVLTVPGHIKMYVEKDGKAMTAQASYGDHSGELSNGVRLVDSIGRGNYRVWRYKGN